MKEKIISGFIALLIMALSVATASAYYYEPAYIQNVPTTNPQYENYFEGHGFLRDNTYRDAVKTWHYQQATSPFIIASSPYGKRPWFKPYGDGLQPSQTVNTHNPFWGFVYIRGYSCSTPYTCNYQNIFLE